MPERPFLNEFWRDVGVLASLVGVVLAVGGLIWGAIQLFRATSELRKTQSIYQRHLFIQTQRVLNEAATHVGSNHWQSAAIRLRDAAALLAQAGTEWEQVATKLLEFAGNFERVAQNDLGYRGFAKKWLAFSGDVLTRVAAKGHPFDSY
jgi:hypothetical protein